MNRILDWALERAQERSTWLGAVLLLSSFGVAVSPELQAAIIQVGLAVSGLLLVLIKNSSSGAADKGCDSAWNKDPVFGVIGIQTGPRERGVHIGFHCGDGSRF